MTIRFQCSECDSVLKIKDELAGTDGKCPKCKTKFVVPALDEADQDESTEEGSSKASSKKESRSGKGKTASKKRSKASASKGGKEDDFDPAAFLMEDGPGPKASAGLSEAQGGAGSAAKGKPSAGRGGSRARAASMSSASASPPAADTADPQANTTASANARDLLSKSADESRVRAASMPVEEKKPLIDFDFAGLKQELKRFAPHVIGTFVGIGLLFWYMGGDSKIDLPELGNVSGTVTVDGKPLVGVAVKFTLNEDVRENPEEGPKRVRTVTGITDEEGFYTFYYLDGIKGAPVGKGKLWMEVRSAQDLKKVPAEWASLGSHNREVKKTGNNREGEFDIVIKSKPKPQPQ